MLFAIRNGGFSGGIMPANVVVGDEAEAVADFLSRVLGQGRASPRRGRVLDLREIREDPEPTREGLRRRGFDVALLDEALELDERRRALLPRARGAEAAQERGLQDHRRAAAHRRGRVRGDRRDQGGLGAREGAGRGAARSSRSAVPPCSRRCRTRADPTSPPEDEVLREEGEAGKTGRSHVELLAEHLGTRGGRSGVGLALRLPEGPARAAGVRARAVGARAARGEGLHAGRPAGAGARAGPVRHRHAAGHRAADLPGARGRAVPGRHLGGAAGLAARRRDLRAGRAAAPLRRVLHLLPARGGRRRQGHAGHLPGAPVRQGRDVQLRRAGGTRPTSTSGCSRSRRRSCGRSRSPTGW